MADNFLKNFAFILTLLTAYFYFLGVAVHRETLSILGAPDNLFTLSFESALMSGFEALHILLREFYIYVLPTWIVFVFIILAYYTIKNYKKSKSDSNSKPYESSEPEFLIKGFSFVPNAFKKMILLIGDTLMLLSLILAFITILFTFTLFSSSYIGEISANDLIEKSESILCSNNDSDDLSAINFSWNGTKYRGVILASSDDFLLIYTDELKAVTFNKSNIDFLYKP